eukprot:4914842-Amphidinium_carterae.3
MSDFGGLSNTRCSGGMSAVKKAVDMSTEHHVVSFPQNAESIHRNSGASMLLVEFDSSCSHG